MSKGYPKEARVRDYVTRINTMLTEIREEVYLLKLCALTEEPSSLNATPDPGADKRAEPDCGARTLIGDSFVACDKEHTHYGAHRVVLPDGRVVKWEPLPPDLMWGS